MYKEVEGDLIHLAREGKFQVVGHGCNCFCTMGAGIAPIMAKEFGCNTFPLEYKEHKGDINKLGQIDYKILNQYKPEFGGNWVLYPDEEHFTTGKKIAVVNIYSQYGFGLNHEGGSEKPIDYDALTLAFRKMNHIFKFKHIGLPGLIGCGLAGGDPLIVKDIIKKELKDCYVTIVYLKK